MEIVKGGLLFLIRCGEKGRPEWQYISVMAFIVACLMGAYPSISSAGGLALSGGSIDGISLVYSPGLADNHSPVIDSFVATPNPAPNPYGKIVFTIKARDMDGDTLSYALDFGDGTTMVSGCSAEHVYTKAGTYSATAFVSDDHGHGVFRRIQVIINDIPPAKVTGLYAQ